MLQIYIDGGCAPVNPGGTAAYGILACSEEKRLGSDKGIVGKGPEMSNNVAEYYALGKVLQYLILNCPSEKEVRIYSDSNLLVQQMSGKFRAKKGLYLSHYRTAKALLEQVKEKREVIFIWIPRENNLADTLVQEAFDVHL